jgi:hypothetical protein
MPEAFMLEVTAPPVFVAVVSPVPITVAPIAVASIAAASIAVMAHMAVGVPA